MTAAAAPSSASSCSSFRGALMMEGVAHAILGTLMKGHLLVQRQGKAPCSGLCPFISSVVYIIVLGVGVGG